MSLTAFASILTLTSLAALASAQENCRDPYANQTIEWVDCPVENVPTLQCGTINVPVDYTDLGAGSLVLPIVRIPAIGSSPRGSIITNPGGPGQSGIEDVINNGPINQNITGTDFHIVSFDPRGVGLTTPYQCPNIPVEPGYDLPLSTAEGLNATYVSFVNQGLYCDQPEYRTAGELIGTAFTAHDLMEIVQALGEDGMIRYWGSSYGTLLGSTLAAMFPDKIDRMILDGNINPTDYYHGLNEESVDDVDAAVSYFFAACVAAGPEYCVLASENVTGKMLEQSYYNYLEGYANGSYVFIDSTDEAWSYSRIKSELFGNLKLPHTWSTSAQAIYNFWSYSQDATNLTRRDAPFDPLDSTTAAGAPYVGLYGITCSDWDEVPSNGTLDDFADWLKLYQSRSKFGGDQLISILYACATWKVNAKEKYTGSFENIKTANPILFINGHLDPVTPLISAINASAGFIGSGVLETNQAGHCTGAEPSQCVYDKITAYFDTGKLPDFDLPICNPDVQTFFPITEPLKNSTDPRGSNITSHYQKRFDHDPNFEYPAALRNVKRDVYEFLLEKRESTGNICTSLATGTGSSSGSGAAATSSSTSGVPRRQNPGTVGALALMAAVVVFIAMW